MGVRVTPGMSVLDDFEICNPSDPGIIQTYPDVVYNGENYQLVWSDEKFGAYYVTAGRVSPGGIVLDTGICVSSGAGSYEYQPQIAFDGTRCLAVWPKDAGIQGRLIDRNGSPEGAVLNLVSNGSGPSIAYGDSSYLVAWFCGSYPALNVRARLFATDGIPSGAELVLTTDGDCNRWPDVLYDGDHYVVVWTKGANSPASQYVWAQNVSASGNLAGESFLISSSSADQRWFPVIAASDTNYLVAWGQSGSMSNIMGNVDHGMNWIEESHKEAPAAREVRCPSILKGLPAWISNGEYRFFDCSGRRISKIRNAGIYFIVSNRGEVRKITIVK